jgi:hypothetical protein
MKRSTIHTVMGTAAGAAAGLVVGFIGGAGLMAVKSGENRDPTETGAQTTVHPLPPRRGAMTVVRHLPRSG